MGLVVEFSNTMNICEVGHFDHFERMRAVLSSHKFDLDCFKLSFNAVLFGHMYWPRDQEKGL